MTLKIASFNIFKDDGDFPNRIYKIRDEIKSLDLDFLALQEDYDSSNICSSDIINESLKYHKTTSSMRAKIRKSKLSHSNLTILSKHDIKEVSKIDFTLEKDDERGALMVFCEEQEKQILLVNTHLSHLSNAYREIQAKKLLESIKSFSADIVILCGDMNSFPHSNVAYLISQDSFYQSNTLATRADEMIDYIFVKSSLAFDLSYETKLHHFSDHDCLVANINVKS